MIEKTRAEKGAPGNGEVETSGRAETCNVCPAKDVVTRDEIAILRVMREIKERVRLLTERIDEIRAPEGVLEDRREWNELFATLEDLRTQWSDWERRLDEAVERKLIALGHREP